MSSTNNHARRKSDAAALLAEKAPPQQQRRKTMGASPAVKNFTPAKKHFTPSKHQVNLGSNHAAAYYFGEHTPGKHHRKHTPAKRNSPETVDEMADTSMLSEGTSSSDGSDLLNKSVLSDTTELTASNFVLQASSRQRLLELAQSKNDSTSNTAMDPENVAPSTRNEQETNTVEKNTAENNGENSHGSARDAHTSGNTPAKSPSLRSRLGESPSSLKKLSASLRKEKQQQEQHRSTVSFMLPPSPVTPKSRSTNTTTTVEIETANDKPLGDVLNNLKQPSTEQQQRADATSSVVNICLSPSSIIASTNAAGTPKATFTSMRQATPFPKKDASFSSPTSTKADDASHFRLGSSSSGGSSHKKLTPTKLSHHSPRRIVNPESVDSPARNTRSAKKSSPAKTVTEQQQGTKRDRDKEDEMEIIGQATLSIRPGNVGRLSELTLSPSLMTTAKRNRRSSIAPPPPRPAIHNDSESVHSSSTASTADLQNLLGGGGSTKETVTGEMPSVAPSPAPTATISIPRSILNSSSRRSLVPGSSSRKSVVFGSPEAAEYRVGSPSISLTPMPRGAAKAMFHMPPSARSQSSDSTVSEMDEDATMEMEAALLQNAAEPKDMDTSVDSSEDTPATKNRASAPPLGQPDEDETVELEPNIEGLFLSAFGSPHSSNASMLQSGEKNGTAAAGMDNSPAESVDMTDAQSIASIASSRSEMNENLEASSQKLNFDESSSDKDEMTVGTFGSAFQSVGCGVAQGEHEEEENTIELEADLTSLLTSTGGATTRQTPKPVTLTEKFPKMDSNLFPQSNRMSFGDALVGIEDETKTFSGEDTFADGSLTKELESNMESLIQATGGNTPSATNALVGNEEETKSLGGEDTFTDGSLTKELESNMETLIQATGGNTPSASRRRSSHRFSLTPGTKVDFSMNEEIQVDQGNTEADMTADSQDYPEKDATVLELDNKEIMTAAGLPLSPFSLEISDLLANANNSSEDFRNPLVAEAMAGFLHAVCGEVEMKAESSSDGDSCFNTIAEENSAQLLELQTILRSSDALTASQGKEELKRLAQSAQAFVEFEWHSWEVQVVDSLAKALDGIAGEFEESEERLMSSMTLADDALEAVSLMEGRAVQRARRQSMSRRKVSHFNVNP